jgi:DNA-binding transcriptional ArsR family regulator
MSQRSRKLHRSRDKALSHSGYGQERARTAAPLFAALGDETRLLIVTRLSTGEPRSISQLTEGSRLTRQAVTKHLRVLERVGVVRYERSGRESRFRFDPQPLMASQEFLDAISRQWDQALARLKAFVEN